MRAEQIKAIRQEMGHTQMSFAWALGCDMTTVSRWERDIANRRGPHKVYVQKITELYAQFKAQKAADTSGAVAA